MSLPSRAYYKCFRWILAIAAVGVSMACASDEPSTRGVVPSASGVVDSAAVGTPGRSAVDPGIGAEGDRFGQETPDESAPAVVILGDSLTAGYGISADEAFPARIQTRVDAADLGFRVVNAGVSGDTTAGGRRRLAWVLDGYDAAVLVVALGGNDGLRGLPVGEMKANLETIVDEAERRGLRVLLTGMEAPPNHGPTYTDAFRAVFVDLAREREIDLYPFLLTGVAGDATLNQADGIHPNPEGAERIAEELWPHLQPLLVAAASTHATND